MDVRYADVDRHYKYEKSIIRDTLGAYIPLYASLLGASIVFDIDLQYTHQIVTNIFVMYCAFIMILLEYRRGILYGNQFNQFLILEYLSLKSDERGESTESGISPHVLADWLGMSKEKRNQVINQLRLTTAIIIFVLWLVVSAIPGFVIWVIE